MSAACLHVIAGVLTDDQGRVLIAQRPPGKHLAGGWEFPGGKLDPGEARDQGLRRELREEIGIEVRHCRPLIRLRHRYPERDIHLDVWRVLDFSGEPRGLDAQALRWCCIADLHAAQLLPADRPVIAALRLPARIDSLVGDDFRLLTLEQFAAHARADRWLSGVACHSLDQALTAQARGADFIALLCQLPAPQLAAACDQLNVPVFASGLDEPQAWEAGAVGICRLPR